MRLRVPRAESARPERDEVRTDGLSCSVAAGVRLVVLMLSPCAFSRVTVTAPASCRSPGARHVERADVMTAHLLRHHLILQIIIIIDLLREMLDPSGAIVMSNEPPRCVTPRGSTPRSFGEAHLSIYSSSGVLARVNQSPG
ncbi:hypothetical protein AoKodu_17460 [Actinomyces oris K20]|nr:hypothetical protein AoKodu_17460 [Actinomyces oris K20]